MKKSFLFVVVAAAAPLAWGQEPTQVKFPNSVALSSSVDQQLGWIREAIAGKRQELKRLSASRPVDQKLAEVSARLDQAASSHANVAEINRLANEVSDLKRQAKAEAEATKKADPERARIQEELNTLLEWHNGFIRAAMAGDHDAKERNASQTATCGAGNSAVDPSHKAETLGSVARKLTDHLDPSTIPTGESVKKEQAERDAEIAQAKADLKALTDQGPAQAELVAAAQKHAANMTQIGASQSQESARQAEMARFQKEASSIQARIDSKDQVRINQLTVRLQTLQAWKDSLGKAYDSTQRKVMAATSGERSLCVAMTRLKDRNLGLIATQGQATLPSVLKPVSLPGAHVGAEGR